MPVALTETEKYEIQVIGPVYPDTGAATGVRTMGEDLANRTKWLRARLEELTGASHEVTSVSAGADTITSAAHGLLNDDRVHIISVGGTIPTPLVLGTAYWVVNKTADTIQVAATQGGAAINITDAGSGTMYIVEVVDGAAALFDGDIKLRAELDGKVNLSGANILDDDLTVQGNIQVDGTTTLAGDFNQNNAAATVEFAGAAEFGNTVLFSSRITTGRQGRAVNTGSITGTTAVTINVTQGEIFLCGTPTANRVITLSNTVGTPTEGEIIWIVRPSSGAFTYEVWKEGGAAAMATLAASKHCSVACVRLGSAWRLLMYSGNVTEGAEA